MPRRCAVSVVVGGKVTSTMCLGLTELPGSADCAGFLPRRARHRGLAIACDSQPKSTLGRRMNPAQRVAAPGSSARPRRSSCVLVTQSVHNARRCSNTARMPCAKRLRCRSSRSGRPSVKVSSASWSAVRCRWRGASFWIFSRLPRGSSSKLTVPLVTARARLLMRAGTASSRGSDIVSFASTPSWSCAICRKRSREFGPRSSPRPEERGTRSVHRPSTPRRRCTSPDWSAVRSRNRTRATIRCSRNVSGLICSPTAGPCSTGSPGSRSAARHSPQPGARR